MAQLLGVAVLLLVVPISLALRHHGSMTVVSLSGTEVVLRGSKLLSAYNQSIEAYEGIPYALPPTGPLRFQPPQPYTKYQAVLNATSKRLPCPSCNSRGLQGTEDCLYLNVYIPENADPGELPVLVMLPGHGWAGRWGPFRLLDRRLVLVTLQSRIGALGFLTTGGEEAPGNLGLRDEALALAWIRKNIRGFGGDPNRITLGGVGVGAEAVQLHMVSPLATGSFHQSIAISGSALSPWAVTTDIQDAVKLTRRLAENLGCNCTSPKENSSIHSPVSSKEIVECLQKVSYADIIYGTKHLQDWLGLPPSPFVPVVDGSVLPDSPRRLWEGGRVAKVPLLVGLSRGEGLLTLSTDSNKGLLDNSSLVELVLTDWERVAPVLLAFNSTAPEERQRAAAQLREHYFALEKDNSSTGSAAKEALLRLLADRHVLLPAARTLTLHTAAANRAAFLYLYSWTGSPTPLRASPLHGPEGGRDAEIIFMQPTPTENRTNPFLRTMTADLLDLWTSFTTTGKPTVGNRSLGPAIGTSQEKDPRAVDLVGPGVQEERSVAVKETIAFWDSLPLSENNKTSFKLREPEPGRGASLTSSSVSAYAFKFEALCLTVFSLLRLTTQQYFML